MDNEFINKILQKHNLAVVGFTSIKTGKFNSSFIIDLPENSGYLHDKLVLRIAPPEKTGMIFYERNMMAREVDVIKQVRNTTTLPVPNIYTYDNSRQIIDQDYVLMEFVPGKPLSGVSLSGRKSAEVMQTTGERLKELHQTCQADNFGYPCIMKNFDNWPAAFTFMWENLIDDIHACGVYSFSEAQRVKKALQSQIGNFDHLKQSSLLHMDIWAQNIMVDYQGNLAAIIDWDRALWGDPEIEYAVLDYCGFNNQDFWKGYGNEPVNDNPAQVRRTFYHFYEVQKYLVIWTLRRPDPVGVGSYKKYALETLRNFL